MQVHDQQGTDDIRWTLIGSTAWSGVLHGKGDVISKLLLPLGAKLASAPTLVAHRFIAEGDYVVVEARGQNTTHAGKAYNNTYCFVFHLAGGLIQGVTEYADTALVAEVLGTPDRG